MAGATRILEGGMGVSPLQRPDHLMESFQRVSDVSLRGGPPGRDTGW